MKWPDDFLGKVIIGDCVEAIREMPEASVDAVVCDPPYNISFMNRMWDATGVAFRIETWREAFRVMKPGAHLVAFGGTRTSHRLVCAIEDAGFEIRDCLAWLYGEGFPKSVNVSRKIDETAGAERPVVGTERMKRMASPKGQPNSGFALQQEQITYKHTGPATEAARAWDGWGTALKPAFEPIILARKPTAEGSVTANVLKHGTGAINVDACRIAGPDGDGHWSGDDGSGMTSRPGYEGGFKESGGTRHDLGRWPANVLLDGAAAEALDAQTGTLKSGGDTVKRGSCAGYRPNAFGMESRQSGTPMIFYGDAGGASRFFYTSKAGAYDRWSLCKTCDAVFRQSAPGPRADCAAHGANGADLGPLFGGREAIKCVCRETTLGPHRGHEVVSHPTVKPLDLVRWLVRLVLAKGQVVLDPFMGSGTTAVAALDEGMRFVGIELESTYARIAEARIAHEGTVLDPFGVRESRKK